MPNKFLSQSNLPYNPLRKLRIVLNGLRFAILYDFSVAYKVVVSVVVLAFAAYFSSSVNFLMVLLATALMMAAEMFNTAIEAICDYLETKQDPKIGVIKDIAAAATWLCIATWVVVVVYEVYTLF